MAFLRIFGRGLACSAGWSDIHMLIPVESNVLFFLWRDMAMIFCSRSGVEPAADPVLHPLNAWHLMPKKCEADANLALGAVERLLRIFDAQMNLNGRFLGCFVGPFSSRKKSFPSAEKALLRELYNRNPRICTVNAALKHPKSRNPLNPIQGLDEKSSCHSWNYLKALANDPRQRFAKMHKMQLNQVWFWSFLVTFPVQAGVAQFIVGNHPMRSRLSQSVTNLLHMCGTFCKCWKSACSCTQ